MSDEMETMQSENEMPAQNDLQEQAAPAATSEVAETPVKKRRGRPSKKRTEADAEGENAPASADEEAAAPAGSAFGAKSAAHDVVSRGGMEEPDFGDDGDYDPVSVQHVDSFTPSSRDGLKVVRTYKFNLEDGDDFDE